MRTLLLALAAVVAVNAQCAMPNGLAGASDKDNTGFVDCHGRLTLSGTKIVDENGQPVQLTGMSSHGLHWFPNCYTKESIQFLAKNWGMNLFRAAMYIGEGGYSENPGLKNTMKNIVKWCKEIGIYVLIDWHILVPGNPNDGVYSGAKAFFTEMAQLYKNEKHVIYEICNEPNGVSWSEVRSYANGIISTIRAIDKEGLIIVGTPTWSQDIHLAAANPVSDPYNVMYTFHFYAGSHMSLLSRVRDTSSKIPIFATEWGTSEASGDGGPFLDAAKTFLDTFKELGISWAQWSYADKDEKSAALKPGVCGSKNWDSTSCSGDFLKNYMKKNAQTCSGGGGSMPPPSPQQPAPSPQQPQQPPPTPYQPPPTPYQPPPQNNNNNNNGGNNNNNGGGGGSCKMWTACHQDPGCCQTGQCYAKTKYYSQCRNDCPSGWDCSGGGGGNNNNNQQQQQQNNNNNQQQQQQQNNNQQQNNGGGSCGLYQSCTGKPGCCSSGQCQQKSKYYSQCRNDCPSGWDCSGGGGNNNNNQQQQQQQQQQQNNGGGGGCGKWASCINSPGCCPSGMACYQQSAYYAQCRPDCNNMPGWSCKRL